MVIFALDIGNKGIKMKSERGEYLYPASYFLADTLLKQGVMAFEPNFVFRLEQEGPLFVWGRELEQLGTIEERIDTFGYTDRVKQKKVLRILFFALGRLALDFPEVLNETLDLKVVLGVSTPEMTDEIMAALKAQLVGQHKLEVNGRVFTVVLKEENVSIASQNLGTLLNFAFDEKLERNSRFSEARVGVFNIGGGAISVNQFASLNPTPRLSSHKEGVQELIKTLGSKINGNNLSQVEALFYQKPGPYIYAPHGRGNQDASKDVSQEVRRVLENYTRFTLAPLLTSQFSDLDKVDTIVLSGGGARLIVQPALQDEIGQHYFERLLFSDLPEMSSVRGFYKAGRSLWEQELMEVKVQPAKAVTPTPPRTDIHALHTVSHPVEASRQPVNLKEQVTMTQGSETPQKEKQAEVRPQKQEVKPTPSNERVALREVEETLAQRLRETQSKWGIRS